MNRRTFLKRGLAGGAVLLLGGGGLALIPTKEQGAPTRALAVLGARSFQVLVAIAKRVAPPSADAVKISEGVDSLLRRAPVEVQRDFNKLLGLFENALPGLLFDGRVLPFTRLSPESQDAVLAHWRDSRLTIRRTGYHALRRICLAVAYADESLWPAVGYSPPPVGAFTPMAYDDSKMGVSS
ncbi:MAG TPA: hypothetical protein VGH28_00870 [Polyangiaceae bacterium]